MHTRGTEPTAVHGNRPGPRDGAGVSWKPVEALQGNTGNVTDGEIGKVNSRYLKITAGAAGTDGTARICEMEVFGSR